MLAAKLLTLGARFGEEGKTQILLEPNQSCSEFHRAGGLWDTSPEADEDWERLRGRSSLILGFL